MNACSIFVYRHAMRALFSLLLLPAGLFAQPQPPSFCFVLANDHAALRPLVRTVQMAQHYRRRVGLVNMDQTWLMPEETMALQAGPLMDGKHHWQCYHPVEHVEESYLLIIADTDTMRIDLPDDPSVLIDRAWARGQRDTPEVIRFRKGRYAVEELVMDPWAGTAARQMADRLIAEDEAMYKKELAALEEHYRKQPPHAPPAAPYIPPPPMAEQDWADYWAQQPPLKQVSIDRVSADTVWVRLTGRVMLNGGCGSGMPLFGLEMRTDTGWVECFPFEPTQMDCGMPWADWEDHLVMLPPLRTINAWVGMHVASGKAALLPGRYRLSFVGGNNERQRTVEFVLE